MTQNFSFIVSSYNLGMYIDECLNSLVEQDYPNDAFEIICIDDGSTDDSVERILVFMRRQKNIKLIQTKQLGIEKACNSGIQSAQYPYVVRVDADDFLDPNFLHVMTQAIQKNPKYSFYYPREYILFFSEQSQIRKILPEFDMEEIFARGDFLATGTVYQKQALAAIGLYPVDVKNCGLENYAVILELIKQGCEGLAVLGTKLYYRRHSTNLSISKLNSIINFGHKMLSKYNKPYQTNQFHPYDLKLEEVTKLP